MKKVFLVCTIIIMVLNFTSPFTKGMFYFDENLVYHHGPIYPMQYLLPFTALLYATYLLVRYRTRLSKIQSVCILLFNLSMVGAVIIQVFNPNILVSCYLASVIMCILSFSYENPDMFVNQVTHCFNRRAFIGMTDTALAEKEYFQFVVFINAEYDALRHQFSEKKMDEILSEMTDTLLVRFGLENAYDLDNGVFGVKIDKHSQYTAEETRDIIYDYFINLREISNVKVRLTPYVTIIDLSKEVKHGLDFLHISEYAIDTMLMTNRSDLGDVVSDFLEEKERKRKVLEKMRQAIKDETFEVYYQPIYNVEERKFTSAEALIRLYDEEMGFISPEEFIPLAEEYGMILDIGEIVFRSVCRFMQQKDLESYDVKYIEINLSTVQCMEETLAKQFISIMQEYDIEPGRINFEITETASVDETALFQNMEDLVANGSSFSMDDYGTGFSTARYLISLPLAMVKIDKSILWQAMRDSNAMIVLENTINMLKNLGKEIVVEGVETKDMADVLKRCMANHLQGYYYSKPIPEEEYYKFLIKEKVMG